MVTRRSGDGLPLTCSTAGLARLWASWTVNNAAARVGLARRCLTFFATEWLEDVGPFDVALVLLGVNDAAKGLAGDFKTHFSSIVSILAGLSFKPALILGKPLPLLSRDFVSSSQMISTYVVEVGREQGTLFLF